MTYNLQCVKGESICDGRINCKDASDELCTDECLTTPLLLNDKYIIKLCPDDSSVCLPVKQYCDGIAQCPHGGDEMQSGCTCEDRDLLSCIHEQKQLPINCFSRHWVQKSFLNASYFNCQSLVQITLNSMTGGTDKRGLYMLYMCSIQWPRLHLSQVTKLFD